MKTRHKLSSALAGVCLALTSVAAPSLVPVAFADENMSAEEKALEQTLSTDQPVAEGKIEIAAGHIDMGPKFVDGQWRLMFHDDHESPSVWRDPAEVVLKGGDAAKLPKPDDERYNFVDAATGEDVYVIPQTETSGVVWPGWNTQDPEVISKLDRGATFTLDKVEGPGQFSLYLENGNFSAPQVLWSSDSSEKQDIFVEPNTHTHANWVFTKPGAYFVTVTVHADLADGTHVSDTARLQFAVGDSTSSDDVFAQAESMGDVKSEEGTDQSDAAEASTQGKDSEAKDNSAEESSSTPTGLIVGGIAAVVVLALVIGFFLARKSKSARAEAESELR